MSSEEKSSDFDKIPKDIKKLALRTVIANIRDGVYDKRK